MVDPRAPQPDLSVRGNWATLLLPLEPDDSIDYGLLRAEIEHFVAAGVNGIYSNGSAGEFHAQTEDEFDRISEILAEVCGRAGTPFQIGASHMSAQISRERLRRARTLRPSALQVVLPDWFPLTWTEIVVFLDALAADADPIPLIVYNPPHAKRQLTPGEWLGIAESIPGIAGIKVAGGDDIWFDAMQPVVERLSVFVPGHALASGLARGAHGSYSNVACLSPRGAQRWYELCLRDPAEGLRWERRIARFWRQHVTPMVDEHGLSNMAADKAVAAAGGWLPGLSPRLRWPYDCAAPELVEGLSIAARECVPELFVTG